MIEKTLFILLLLLISLNLSGQDKIEIILDNPYPRVGEKVKILFLGEFLSQEKDASSDKEIEFSNFFFKESREYKVGPFGFVFDDKQYSSNSIKVSVAPKLPIEEGIWVRVYEEDEKFTLIVEQLIKQEKNVKYYSDGHETSFQQTKEFATINTSSENGVYFFMRRSNSTSVYGNEENMLNDSYSYSKQVYSVKLFSSHSKGFKLTPKHFINFPNKSNFSSLVIQSTKKT